MNHVENLKFIKLGICSALTLFFFSFWRLKLCVACHRGLHVVSTFFFKPLKMRTSMYVLRAIPVPHGQCCVSSDGQVECSGQIWKCAFSVFQDQFFHSRCVDTFPWCAESNGKIIILDIGLYSNCLQCFWCAARSLWHYPASLLICGEFRWGNIFRP
jgi:hypothetical protein